MRDAACQAAGPSAAMTCPAADSLVLAGDMQVFPGHRGVGLPAGRNIQGVLLPIEVRITPSLPHALLDHFSRVS